MDRRLKLQAFLELVVGNPNVYFQPPNNLMMKYPCALYELDDIDTDHANNVPYRQTKRWAVTVIDTDPDSPIVEAISKIPLCVFSRQFTADGLIHTVFTLYF